MQPQKYERNVDFTQYEGDETDHAAINAELDAAALSINEIRTNLAKIQKDDGGIKVDEQLVLDLNAVIAQSLAEAEAAADAALLSAFSANDAKNSAEASKVSAEAAEVAASVNAQNAADSYADTLAAGNAAVAAITQESTDTQALYAQTLASINALLAAAGLPAVPVAKMYLRVKADASGYEYVSSAAAPVFFGFKLSADQTELVLTYGNQDDYDVANFDTWAIGENVTFAVEKNNLVSHL